MDLESYIGRYSGETRLQRCLLIARTTPDETVANQAFDMAEAQMKEAGNVKRYKEIFGGTGVDNSNPNGKRKLGIPTTQSLFHCQNQI